MNALELIQTIEASGGQIRVDDLDLVITPRSIVAPLREQLIEHKPEIIRLLAQRALLSEPTKPTKLLISGPEHDPAAWRTDFNLWRVEHSISRPGCDDAGGIRCLWGDFCDWAIQHHSVPCTHPTFKRLLIDAGFELRDGMVLGLVLREDYESVRNWPARRR